ncbi:Ig-like domain-containing protein [Geotalea toluenoxydans]|uniref:Ig-like domain-containing protein n=1 Tax=Geotalea toluenoxydans TaxID=421624 RepID=UPI000ABF8E7A|nr:Ig-like domain-containing protein [Geotalea toluenoxydans]
MRKIFVNLTFLLLLLILPTVARAALTYNVDPTDGTTGVSVNIATVSITFNEAMQLSSFTDRVSGIPIDSITASADKKTLYFHLSSTLSYSTTYTVTINKKVKNDNNVKIGDLGYSSGISWSFTTMAKPLTDTTPPTVASTFPTAGATGVAVSAVVRATFSEVMNQATLTTSTFTVSAGGSPITGAVTMDPTNKIAYFTPSVNLSSNTVYTATITTGVRDAAGNAMTVAYSWNFTTVSTDATPPTIVSVSPLSGGTSVPVSTLVSATFSEAMDAATITSASFTLKAGATSISGSVAYDNGIFAATFTPLSALANSTTYTATITTTAKDLAGNALTSTYTWTFTTVAATAVPPASDYCQIPPYVTSGSSSLKPNVLILLDNSGSMAEFAYKTEGKGSSNKNYDDSYNPDASYYGYFDSTKMYSYYTTSGGYFRVDPALAPDKTSFWSGNFLNWLTMRRVDIIRKVLVGGKTSPRSANVANYLIPLEDPDRDFYKTYNNVKYMVYGGTSKEQIVNQNTGTSYTLQVYVGDQLPQEGIILTMADKIRFGIEIFNDAGQKFETGGNGTADGGNIIVDIGSTGTNLITQIESADPSTWTPLAESFYEATRYFQATTGAFTNANYAAKDPIQFKCQKNFILILTDGESTMDRNLPGGNWQSSSNANPIADNVTSPNNFNVETWMDSIATQENITSQWATDANPSGGTYYLEGVAYWAHNTDMRSSVRGKNDIPGSQNITTYAVFAFDDSAVGRDLLKKAAKYGGFNDYDHTGKPDNAAKWDRDGNGVPDTYYEAQNGAQLAGELLKALNDILARVSAGTAASILSNSEGSGANILQAVFYPKKFFDAQTSADWIGEMHNMWYYIDPFINNSSIREDSDYPNPNTKHELNLGTDKVVNFYFNTAQSRTLVQRSTDSLGDGQPDIDTNGDGVKDTYTFVDEVDPDYVKSIWKAGKQLWSRTSSRTLYTQLNGTLTNFATLDTTLASTQSFLQAANKTEADKIIAFTLALCRNRAVIAAERSLSAEPQGSGNWVISSLRPPNCNRPSG